MRISTSLAITQPRGVGGGFTPLSLAPALWLDASSPEALVTDGAASFASASSQYLSAASNATLQTGDVDFWFGGWMYLADTTNYRILGGKDGIATGVRDYSVFYDHTVGRFLAQISNAAGTQVVATANNFGPPTAGAWHFVLAWHDSLGDTLNILVNGGAANSVGTAGLLPVASAQPFWLGRISNGGSLYHNGRLDSVAFGKSPPGGIASVITALSTSLYNGGAGKTYFDLTSAEKTAWGLVSWWNLNELSGARYDSHGTNHLSDTNGVGYAAGVASGRATADGDPVSLWTDLSGNGRHVSQTTATKRPTLRLAVQNGRHLLQPDSVDDYLGLPSPLSLTGAFTLYAVGTRAAASLWIPLGATAAGGVSAVLLFGDNNLYVAAAAASISTAYTGSAGAILMRVRRSAAGVVYIRATGMAEGSAGSLSGAISPDTIMGRPGNSQYTSTGNKYGELIVTATDLVTDSPSLAAATESYLTSKWGVTF